LSVRTHVRLLFFISFFFFLSLRVKNSPPTLKNRFNPVIVQREVKKTQRTYRGVRSVCRDSHQPVCFIFHIFSFLPRQSRVQARHTPGPRSCATSVLAETPETRAKHHSAVTTSVPRDRWVVVCHSNVLRDSCGPVTSDASAVFTHHAGHSNRRLDTWTRRRREVQQQLRRSDRQILAQQMRSWWMTPPDYSPQAPQTTQVIMADLVVRLSKLVRLHGAGHKKVNHPEDPVCTPLRSKWSTIYYYVAVTSFSFAQYFGLRVRSTSRYLLFK